MKRSAPKKKRVSPRHTRNEEVEEVALSGIQFNTFPKEIKLMILSHLSGGDLAKFLFVSKDCRSLSLEALKFQPPFVIEYWERKRWNGWDQEQRHKPLLSQAFTSDEIACKLIQTFPEWTSQFGLKEELQEFRWPAGNIRMPGWIDRPMSAIFARIQKLQDRPLRLNRGKRTRDAAGRSSLASSFTQQIMTAFAGKEDYQHGEKEHIRIQQCRAQTIRLPPPFLPIQEIERDREKILRNQKSPLANKETLRRILSYLRVEHLFSCRRVCRRWWLEICASSPFLLKPSTFLIVAYDIGDDEEAHQQYVAVENVLCEAHLFFHMLLEDAERFRRVLYPLWRKIPPAKLQPAPLPRFGAVTYQPWNTTEEAVEYLRSIEDLPPVPEDPRDDLMARWRFLENEIRIRSEIRTTAAERAKWIAQQNIRLKNARARYEQLSKNNLDQVLADEGLRELPPRFTQGYGVQLRPTRFYLPEGREDYYQLPEEEQDSVAECRLQEMLCPRIPARRDVFQLRFKKTANLVWSKKESGK